LRVLFDRSAIGVALLDGGGAIVHANAAVSRLLGMDAAAVHGRRLFDFAPAEDAALIRSHTSLAHGAQGSATLEARIVRPDGTLVWGSLAISPADVDESVRFTVILQDLTERRAVEAKLVHQAYHDPLTALANRELFHD